MNGIYFSGNGNTKHCMEVFTKATGGRAVSIESPEAILILQEASQSKNEIALGYPIHYSNIPRIVKDFILKNEQLFHGKKIFIIATMGLFSGDGAGLGARILKKHGATILGGLHLRMPDAIGDVKMLKKSMDENQNIIKATEEKISLAADSINHGKYPKNGLFFWNRIAGFLGQRLWFIPTAKKLTTKLNIHSDLCTACGKCASECPTKSIKIKNGKAVFTQGHCTICYRCINSCPSKAITLLGKKVLEQCRFDVYKCSKIILAFMLCCVPCYTQTVYQQEEASQKSHVKIIISNIQSTSGTIVMSIHDSEKSFNKRIPLKTYRLTPQISDVCCELELIPGEYAFCVYQDLNNDNNLNSNIFGIPKEPFGFSNYEGKSVPGNFKKHKVIISKLTEEVEIPLVVF